MIPEESKAYLAAVVDIRGYLTTRVLSGTELPVVSVMMKPNELIGILCQRTGVRPITVGKGYNRTGCAEHCPEQHIHMTSRYQRWIVVGTKATVVLQNLLPYMVIQHDRAQELIAVGRQASSKAKTVSAMRELGWSA